MEIESLKLFFGNTYEKLNHISDDEAGLKKNSHSWSRKEIIGHLIDSASNNHKRFVCALLSDTLTFDRYNQDEWVSKQNYQARKWDELINLFFYFNLQILHFIKEIPEDQLIKIRMENNLNDIAFRKTHSKHDATLQYLIDDYYVHLKHHITQILEYEN